MTYYHPKKEQAEAVAAELAKDPRVLTTACQFEPHNGWIVVLVPRPMDLSEFADRAEIQDGIRRPRGDKLKPRPLAPEPGQRAPREPREPGQPKGYSAHPSWTIIDRVHTPTTDRDTVLRAIVAGGHDPKTASRQYRHWLKAKGLWK